MSICRLFPSTDPPDPEVLRRIGGLATSLLSDAMDRTGGAVGVLPVPGTLDKPLVGPAFTVQTVPGDNLVVHKALDLAEPGDILVIDAGGEVNRSILGEIVVRYGASRGIAGFVVDGAIRDALALGAFGVPVFARGVCHLGPYKNGPGALRGPISVGGAVVRNGDIIKGDSDGIVVVPAARAHDIAAAAEEAMRCEDEVFAAIERGNLDRTWIDALLKVDWDGPEGGGGA